MLRIYASHGLVRGMRELAGEYDFVNRLETKGIKVYPSSISMIFKRWEVKSFKSELADNLKRLESDFKEEDGIVGSVRRHPLMDWEDFNEYRAPDPNLTNGMFPRPHHLERGGVV